MRCRVFIVGVRAETETRVIGLVIEPDGAAQAGSLSSALLAWRVAHYTLLHLLRTIIVIGAVGNALEQQVEVK